MATTTQLTQAKWSPPCEVTGIKSSPGTHRGYDNLNDWMSTHPYGFQPDATRRSTQWRVTRVHMELAIRFSNNSSSGTDGIPYAAWHKAGRQAAVVFQEAVAQIR